MKQNQIKRGVTYTNRDGSLRRRLIVIEKRTGVLQAVYEQIWGPRDGRILRCGIQQFCRWADREAGEIPVTNRLTKQERKLIGEVIDRAVTQSPKLDRFSLAMDLAACHGHAQPLDLKRLLDAPDFDFWHDLRGIEANLDRHNLRLMGFFLPRFAL